ncbi:membrane bound O-acyl transferase family-domain-containing protein [Xylariales sp. PMI_506]|nr:membrane bound O-acyl transferase family-domain-containing protein [Xylariales sp. PMI_506]
MARSTGLAEEYNQIYRARFSERLASGDKTPILFHFYVLSSQLIPALYLTIPHKNRPWLYRLRWVILAITTTIQMHIILSCSSNNVVAAYAFGILSAWGILWNFTLLVWTRPQWDAKRVQRTKPCGDQVRNLQTDRAVTAKTSENEGQKDYHLDVAAGGNGSSGFTSSTPRSVCLSEPRYQESYGKTTITLVKRFKSLRPFTDRHEIKPTENATHGRLESSYVSIKSSDRNVGYMYDWQPFPEDESFCTRFCWAFDLSFTARLTGWDWAPYVFPPYYPPPLSTEGDQLSPGSLPKRSSFGYTRVSTRGELFLQRVFLKLVPCYIYLDLVSTYFLKDPYFLLGPTDAPPPAPFSSLPPILLSMARSFLCLLATLSVLEYIWNILIIGVAFLGPPILGFRADPWHLPSLYGSFNHVLDHGLPGFWGVWWHQSFRFGFTAPTKWMVRHGYLEKNTDLTRGVATMVAFVQSGFLHAAGSYVTVPDTKPWNPFIFFILAGIGAFFQYYLCRAFKENIERLPRWIRRAANLVSSLLFLYAISWLLLDDLCRMSVLNADFVPFSIVRWLGFGTPGESLWRWRRDELPDWYEGKRWWQSGLAW